MQGIAPLDMPLIPSPYRRRLTIRSTGHLAAGRQRPAITFWAFGGLPQGAG